MLVSIEDGLSVQHTVGWTQKEILFALRAFSKYGNNFQLISLIIRTILKLYFIFLDFFIIQFFLLQQQQSISY